MSNGKKTDKPSPPASSRSDELITQKEYAARKGWSKQYVNQLVKQGRISLREGKIDPAAADAALSRSKDPARDAQFRAPPIGNSRSSGAGVSSDGSAVQGIFGKSRTVREHYRALLAKVEYEERIGLLVRMREVEEVLFTAARTGRDHFLMKAQLIGEELAAEFNLDKRTATAIVRKHIKDSLSEFARLLMEAGRTCGNTDAGKGCAGSIAEDATSDNDEQ